MSKTTLLLFSVLLLVSGPALAQSPSGTQEQDDVVRVSTSVVTVPVSVLDRQGRLITSLSKEDFHVYEDGVEQEIAFFETADKPFTVALLLDTSDSTKLKLAQIQEAAVAFLDRLRPEDQVLVVAFDRNVNVMTHATADRSRAAAAIRRTKSGGGTSVYDAIALATERLLKQTAGRKAVIVFTDGVDTTSTLATYDGTLRTTEQLDALVYTIRFPTDADVASGRTGVANPMENPTGGQLVTAKGEPLEAAYRRAGLYLQGLAERSGGRFFLAGTIGSLSEAFGRIADELRQQYSLGFYPKNRSADGKRRRLKVTVGMTDATVRARRAYVYKPAIVK